jgi:opacity protein-like surface antigen
MKPFNKAILLSLATALVAAAPALAQPPGPPDDPNYPPPPPPRHHQETNRFGELRFWVGAFRPTASSDYWHDNFANFTGSRNDFQDVIGGGDFIYHFDRMNAIMVSVSGYTGNNTEAYRFFADQDNNPIVHHTRLEITSGSFGYALFPAGTHNAVIPYLGAGVGLYSWRLTENGDFIDPSNNIFGAHLSDSGTAFGYYFVAGLEVPVSRHVALLVDGRYTVAHDNLGGAFSGFNRLDLSGGQLAGGVALHL